ncbi:MAG: pseudouridine synthase [Candidatus Binatia bacterium]|nr:MAG: pseudouridine synthase [Candidatus Binatia bacterium]
MASRRKSEELLLAGRVRVNGRVVRELGTRVVPGRDRITLDGRLLRPVRSRVYVLLHKPRGVVTTVADPERRPTVLDLLGRFPARVFPVGRLDVQSSGLLLLTNDGNLAHSLLHPSFEVEREYAVKIEGTPRPEDLERLCRGVRVDGELLRARRAALRKARDGKSWISLVLTEGRRHEVRRLCRALGYPVLKLRRIRFGPLRLGTLPPGRWRHLSAEEVAALRRLARRRSGREPR